MFYTEHVLAPRGTPEFRGIRVGNRCVSSVTKAMFLSCQTLNTIILPT